MRRGNGRNYLNIPLPPHLKGGGGHSSKEVYGEPEPMLIAQVRRGNGNLGVIVADALRARGWTLRASKKKDWILIYGTPPVGDDED